MKQQNLRLSTLLLAAFLATSCSNENDPVVPIPPANNPDAVELGVTAGVSLTKSAITGGETQTGTANTIMQSIAVFAVGSTENSYGGSIGNNKAVYKQTNGTWTNAATDNAKKILLTNEVATIYAVHPAYDGGTAEWNIKPSASATIGISVFADASQSVSKDVNNTIPTTGNGILSAPGEIDYMYAVDGKGNSTAQATASNGRTASGGVTENAWQVSLKMKHALSMVSFCIYNDGTYAGPGKLTKIVLKNSSGTALSKGTTPTMAIKDGTITPGSEVAATYTRFIGDNGYVLKKQGSTGLTTADATKNASSKFSMLVLPHSGAKNTMQVEFTIDGVVYVVSLAANNNNVNWSAGSNNLYTAVLSGKELTLSPVTVEAWDKGVDKGDLPIN